MTDYADEFYDDLKRKREEKESVSCSAPAAGSAEIKCKACGWLGLCDDVLTSDHPFQKGCHVYGCPQCGEIEGFEQQEAAPNV